MGFLAAVKVARTFAELHCELVKPERQERRPVGWWRPVVMAKEGIIYESARRTRARSRALPLGPDLAFAACWAGGAADHPGARGPVAPPIQSGGIWVSGGSAARGGGEDHGHGAREGVT